jgi:hypothetical protein
MMLKKTDSLAFNRRRMEEAFFRQQDKILVERQKELQKMEETKEALKAASGVLNDAVLEKLVELGIRPETLAPLSIIPLIQTAWADGSVSREEADAVLTAADRSGIKIGTIENDLLREWLSTRPSEQMIDAWKHYLGGLVEKLTAPERDTLKSEILGHARRVAEASGGLLGIGKISRDEKKVLDEIEAAFG